MIEFDPRFRSLSIHYTNEKRYAKRLNDALLRIATACESGDVEAVRREVQAALATPRPPSPFGDSTHDGQVFLGHPYPEYLDLPGTEYTKP